MDTLTIEDARRRDTLCLYWVSDPAEYVVLTGRTSGYRYGAETVPTAVVLPVACPGETSALELEHLIPVAHCPGLLAQVEAGERVSWESGRASANDEHEGMMR